MPDYKIYKSPGKIIRPMLLCILVVACAIIVLEYSEVFGMVAYLSIFFFGLRYALGVYRLFDTRPQIIINEIGIFDRKTHKNVINWEIIKGAYLTDIYNQKFICLIVDERFEPSKFTSKFSRNIAVLLKAIGFQELNISLCNITINAERLTELILALRSADNAKREALIRETFLLA